MKRVINKHPLAIRWFHWINFPVLSIMIWSGILIYWANDVYRLGWGDKTLIKFFPDSFYATFNINHKLSTGMAFHFFFMWFFFVNGALYVLYTLISGEWRYLLPGRHSFREAWQVVLHDLHIRKTAPPQDKYNAAQRIAYTAIIIMGFGSLVTGICVYKPVQFGWLCALCGGYSAARVEHFILTIGYVLFFLVHVFQVILAGWNNFQAMITGFEIMRQPKPAVVVAQEAEAQPPTTPEVPIRTAVPEVPIVPAVSEPEIPAEITPPSDNPEAQPETETPENNVPNEEETTDKS